MRNTLVEASVSALIRRGIVDESERELYRFGINGLFLFVVNIITSIAIGILCGMLWQSLLFSAAYIPLRRYAGGYHAKTPGRCYCLSVLLILCVLMILKYVAFSSLGVLAVLVVSAVIIFIKAPVASENKPLSQAEQAAYQKRARIILLAEIIVTFLLMPSFISAAGCMAVAVGCSAFMTVIVLKRPFA